jgi:pimeloyl-ACP methyl ester carboxylesterase
MLPFDDFGGPPGAPPLHLAHANGYPPRAYQPLVDALTPHYRVSAMHTRPLRAAGSPGDLGCAPASINNWWPLVDELVQFIDERGQAGGFGLGHSLGAVLTTAAALRRPDLFRAIVLIDPEFQPPRTLAIYQVFQNLGLAHRVHPLAPGAKRRRRVFGSYAEMIGRYRQAAVFAGLSDAALRTFVEAAAHPRPDGQVELVYSPEWELRVYVTGPLNLWGSLGNLRVPALFIQGAESDTFKPAAVQAVRQRLPGARIEVLPGHGHLVPLEAPQEVGRLVHAFFAACGHPAWEVKAEKE